MRSVFLLSLIGSSVPFCTPQAIAETPVSDESERVLERVDVSSARLRNSADTLIEPERIISNEELISYGVGSLEELLEILGPEVTSSRGRGGERPVILVDGVRVSGFREIRNYPIEAIERVDILPEEAALRYGFSANQRVLNFILKPNFNALTADLELGGSLEGGGFQTELDTNYLNVFDGRRFSLDGEIETQEMIREVDRGLAMTDQPGTRSLTPASKEAAFTAVYNLPPSEDLRITATADLILSETKRLNGFPELEFTLPATSPFSTSTDDETFSRFFGARGALRDDSDTVDADLTVTVVKEFTNWRWTTNAQIGREVTNRDTDREPDASAFQDELDALNAAVSPSADLVSFLEPRRELTERTEDTLSVNTLFNGGLWDLPAGQFRTSLTGDLSYQNRISETELDGQLTRTDLDRTIVRFQGSADLPLIDSDMEIWGIRSLDVGVSGAVRDYSDFGQLTNVDGTINWAPFERLSLLASYSIEEGAPSIGLLGDTVTTTPNVEVFDFVAGDSVLATRIDGGNENLLADTRHVFRVSGGFEPFENENLDVRVTYLDTRIDDPIGRFPSVDDETEAAFPDRFVRDTDGNLLSFDTRPVNFIEETRRELKWRLIWHKTFTPERSERGGRRGERPGRSDASSSDGQARGTRPGREGSLGGSPPQSPANRPRASQDEQAAAPTQGERAPEQQMQSVPASRFLRGSRSGRGTRVYLFVNHTWTLENTRLLADGLAEQDFLNGSAIGALGGTPEHQIRVSGGLFRNGAGIRAWANWQSGTEVSPDDPNSALDFSDLLTANLRMYYTLNDQNPISKKVPWLEGARLSIDVDNLFDETLTVTDSDGSTPQRYQGDRLDPIGRALRVGIRKQF